MEDIERLENIKSITLVKVGKAYKDYAESKRETNELRKQWDELRESYESIDRQLAEIDGRLTIIPRQRVMVVNMKNEKTFKQSVLTLEQIKVLALKLGVKLDID